MRKETEGVVLGSNPVHSGLRPLQAAARRRPDAIPDPLADFARAARAAGDGELCLVPIPLDLPEAADARLALVLSAAERQRALRFMRPRDRRRYIVAHACLRHLLAERLGIGAGQVALGRGPWGKPALQGPQAASGWHFNLSYSDGPGGALALCALSRRGPVGVDVEWVRPLADAELLARQFFSPREFGLYRRLDPGERLLGFFHGWTRKEAFVKALGTGLSHNLADFDMSLAPGTPARILQSAGVGGAGCGWHLESIGPAGGRVAAVVTTRS